MSGKITPNVIEVRQGDSFTINMALNNKCKPMNLTGWTGQMQVRQRDSGAMVISCTADPVDAAKGKLAFVLTPAMTSADVGDYVCDIQIVSPTGEIHTVYPADVNKVATFKITAQVTV